MQKLVCLFILMPSVCYFAICSDMAQLLSYAQESNTKTDYLTLEDAVGIALNNNPLLKSKKHNIGTYEGRIKQARLLPNPEIEFFTQETPTNNIGFDQSQNSVALSQKLETGGKRKLRVKAARKEKKVMEMDLQTTIADITAKVKKSFFNVLTTEEELKFAKKTIEIAKSLMSISNQRFKIGDIARIDVLKAEIELSNAKMRVQNAERKYLNTAKMLQTVMGVSDIDLNNLLPISTADTPSLNLENLNELLLNNHPALKARKKVVDLSVIKITEAKRMAIPDINATIGYKRLSTTDINTVQAGIEFSLPIFNRNQGKIIEARALSHKAKDDVEVVRNQLLLQLSNAFSLYTSTREQVRIFTDTIIPQSEESLKIARQGYRQGEFDYLQVLDAQRTLANTRISYLKILNELFSSITEIEKFVGVKISDIK
ncbi:MAG: TolC family protein [Candidatus Scalindua sp.]|nr:TolC family protein [Candidatus Scalindua sp.]MBT5306693.1 TolC family protein [Candidatus Scalindua sp.]MBT6051831.1 TolC family protein [Candidatus Scalindua sp.]MBT6226849.1 TolC family protein [Candidatus Scalindua sp.]MBT7211254.1 TolC family protein [Candidatus Scalindua sp.]